MSLTVRLTAIYAPPTHLDIGISRGAQYRVLINSTHTTDPHQSGRYLILRSSVSPTKSGTYRIPISMGLIRSAQFRISIQRTLTKVAQYRVGPHAISHIASYHIAPAPIWITDQLQRYLPDLYEDPGFFLPLDTGLSFSTITTFVTGILTVYNDFLRLTREFPELTNIDRIPEPFLQLLGDLIKHPENPNFTTAEHREEIRKTLHVWRIRATPAGVRRSLLRVGSDPDVTEVALPFRQVFHSSFKGQLLSTKHHLEDPNYFRWGTVEARYDVDSSTFYTEVNHEHTPQGSKLWLRRRVQYLIDSGYGTVDTARAYKLVHPKVWISIGGTEPWPDDTNPPLTFASRTKLDTLIGYIRTQVIHRVRPDPNGSIAFLGSRYTPVDDSDTDDASRLIYAVGIFGNSLPLTTYREVGLHDSILPIYDLRFHPTLATDEVLTAADLRFSYNTTPHTRISSELHQIEFMFDVT